MSYREEDYLQLSGIQHFLFCRRQWALIHIEQQWKENFLTVDGQIMHENAHNEGSVESRGDILTCRGLKVSSSRLGISGQCDIVEFHRAAEGITLPGREGNWSVFPIEYKHGAPKTESYDIAQLCLQTMCLEEMLCCDIPEGALYYGKVRHRERVTFTEELRAKVEKAVEEMHSLFQKGYTPVVKPTKACKSCSLLDVCLPQIAEREKVKDYLEKMLCDNF